MLKTCLTIEIVCSVIMHMKVVLARSSYLTYLD